jgi:hypothetical protein
LTPIQQFLAAFLLFLCATIAFGGVYAVRNTGEFFVYWPEGIGGATGPAALAGLWAGMRKYFDKSRSFGGAWRIAFVVFALILLGPGLFAALRLR